MQQLTHQRSQLICHFWGEAFDTESDGDEFRLEAVLLLNIGKEVVFQDFGDFRQLKHIDGRTLEDAIDSGAL